MEEEAKCQLNLDQIGYTVSTGMDIKVRKMISPCNSFHLCQNWEKLSAKEPICSDIMLSECVNSRNVEICKKLVEKYSRTWNWKLMPIKQEMFYFVYVQLTEINSSSFIKNIYRPEEDLAFIWAVQSIWAKIFRQVDSFFDFLSDLNSKI